MNLYKNIWHQPEQKETILNKTELELIDDFLLSISSAKGFMERKNYFEKNKYINHAIKIINKLISDFDSKMDIDGSNQLKKDYKSILLDIVKANMKNDLIILESIRNTMILVKNTLCDNRKNQINSC